MPSDFMREEVREIDLKMQKVRGLSRFENIDDDEFFNCTMMDYT